MSEIGSWDAKHVPKEIKAFISGQAKVVQDQYAITLDQMAGAGGSQGDGLLNYLGCFHKRFGGHWCLLYLWMPRRDGNGQFLSVKGIGRKNGTGNDYNAQVMVPLGLG